MPGEPCTPYRERLLPGPGGWAAGVALGVVFGVALWPVSIPAGLVVGAVAVVAAAAALWLTSPVVEVEGDSLRAGPARIPASLLGNAVALSRIQMSRELGPRLDARAYVCLRSWARTGVRIPVEDDADPTPYWLVSTRHPQALIAALGEATAR